MTSIKMIKIILTTLALLFVAVGHTAEKPLKVEVYQADGNSFYVSSVLVTGKTEAVLIDAQFTQADAHHVVANILRTGKKLKSIYISHGDPDYYFGLDVIKQAFPEAKVYATKETLEYITRSVQKKLDFWGPKLGANGPKQVIMPELLKGDSLLIDEHELQIVGLDKHPERTFVWIPAIKTIAGGVPVYGDTHLWIADAGTKAKRQKWLTILDSIAELKPETVIPGHATKEAPKTMASVKFTRDYLVAYEKELAKVGNSTQLIEAINKKYPNVVLPIALEIGAKVATGEMQW